MTFKKAQLHPPPGICSMLNVSKKRDLVSGFPNTHSKMEEEERIVHGPEGVEVVISFLPNNEIRVRVPPSFVVSSEDNLAVRFRHLFFLSAIPSVHSSGRHMKQPMRKMRMAGRERNSCNLLSFPWGGKAFPVNSFSCSVNGFPSARQFA